MGNVTFVRVTLEFFANVHPSAVCGGASPIALKTVRSDTHAGFFRLPDSASWMSTVTVLPTIDRTNIVGARCGLPMRVGMRRTFTPAAIFALVAISGFTLIMPANRRVSASTSARPSRFLMVAVIEFVEFDCVNW